MKRIFDSICVAGALLFVAAGWRTAEPGLRYNFPRDHHAHREFKTEWWYFTGNIADETGRRFGYELTFFRQGIRPPNESREQLSRFVVGDLKFAHFTVTDAAGQRFRFFQKTSRGSFGEAGFDEGERLAWIEDWSLDMKADGVFVIRAAGADASIAFELRSSKPPVIHGAAGISAKASGEGHASHYYSLTRLTTAGELRVGDRRFSVRGESWFDHEWATNQLARDQVGWDWLCVQFRDGTELMLYGMRLAKGEIDPSSSGTFVAADGAATHLRRSQLSMTPRRFWKSKTTGAKYPVEWRVEVPERKLDFVVRPVLDNQELVLPPLTYWEGAVDVVGQSVSGVGYLELTGYAAPLQALQR